MGNDLILTAAFWGGLSAVSLPLGAVIGLWTKPSRKVTSGLMAFGGGALLFALSIELFGHVFHRAGDGHGHIVKPYLVMAAVIAAIVGGLLFNGLNMMLEGKGGFLRRRGLIRRYVVKTRRAEAKQLLSSLSGVEYFRSLPAEEVIKLLENVHTVEFAAGETIFSEGEDGRQLFVIAEGSVGIVRNNNGASDEIAVLGNGDVVGEMALVTAQPRSATAVAKDDVKA